MPVSSCLFELNTDWSLLGNAAVARRCNKKHYSQVGTEGSKGSAGVGRSSILNFKERND